jgi:ubiquinone biosynthesis protein
MIRAFRHTIRLYRIARVLARHDALFLLDNVPAAKRLAGVARMVSSRTAEGRPGQRLARALAELGPSFIKLGQALSTRSDLVGEDVALDLADLQDNLPPFPFAEVEAIIREDFDADIADLFQEFDPTPVAAASVAQVHRAITLDGQVVAVKVVRPEVEAAFERDLDLLFWIAEITERTQPNLRRLRPVESVQAFAQTVSLEMDLRFEAAAASEMAENFRTSDDLRVPAVLWQLTSKRVMCTEWISGIPVDERDAIIAAGLDPQKIAERAARSFFRMVFEDGFFHGDLHPGNLFVDTNGRLIAVDFGIMGRVDQTTRNYLGEMLLAFLNADYKRVAEIHFEAGYVPADKSVDAFAQASRSVAEPILGLPAAQVSVARLLAQLFKITETFGMETQPQLLVLQKTMLTAEGVGRSLCPDVNFWELARPLIEDWMALNVSAPARVKRTLEDTLHAAAALPNLVRKAERITNQFTENGLKLHPDTVRSLMHKRRSSSLQAWLPWLLVIVLLVLFLAD